MYERSTSARSHELTGDALADERRGARVALALGGIGVDVITIKSCQRRQDLVVLGLGFLQADDITPEALDDRDEVFFDGRTNTVHVPGEKTHEGPLVN